MVLSLKPLKKSDLGKDWVSGRRSKKVKLQPEYHLIVTEGTDTEPAYFDEIRRIINESYRDRIQLDIEGKGDNTISLFEKAKRKAFESPNDYRHVWVVYDTDDFPAEHINKTMTLCEQNTNSEICFHAIWSNQCIELWFLLHFGYYQADIYWSEYWPKLTEWLTNIGKGEYTKNRSDMYSVLRPYIDVAINNAKRLDKTNAGRTPADSSPGTKVYELVEYLKPYL